jgi:hypothetical protein
MIPTDYTAYQTRLSALSKIADVPSDPTGQETLRGYMVARGTTLPLTFERSVYNTIASEWAFGITTVQALVDPASIVTIAEPPAESQPELYTPDAVIAPEINPSPIIEPETEQTTEPAVTPDTQSPVPPASPDPILLSDQFTGGGNLNTRVPDTIAPTGAMWSVETGTLSLNSLGAVGTNNTARAVVETAGADVEVESTLKLGADGTGIILRSLNRSNYLRFSLTRTIWLFQKTVEGVTTTVASGRSTYPLNTNYTLKASMSGPSIVLSIDGVVVRSLSEPFNETATRHGVLCSNTGARTWDTFLVRRLP